ncbi:hypothetical protein Droror1_Dr00023520 [Drosera rotundifolia]
MVDGKEYRDPEVDVLRPAERVAGEGVCPTRMCARQRWVLDGSCGRRRCVPGGDVCLKEVLCPASPVPGGGAVPDGSCEYNSTTVLSPRRCFSSSSAAASAVFIAVASFSLPIFSTDIAHQPERVEGPFLRHSVSKVSCGWKHTTAIAGKG